MFALVHFHSFHATGLFLYPPEIIRKTQDFGCFQGVSKRLWHEMDQKFVLCFHIFQLNISEKMIFINVWRHIHQQGFHLVRKTFLAIILCQHKYLHLLFKNLKKVLQKQPPEVFCKRGFLKNFAKFTGKYLCQSPGPATL